jgi:hypothetical protein
MIFGEKIELKVYVNQHTNSFTVIISFVFSLWIINEFHNDNFIDQFVSRKYEVILRELCCGHAINM